MEREARNTRDHLLDVGKHLFRQKGFSAVGLSELLSQAQVPKGSFYHYFRSKEIYGVEMLEQYFQDYDQSMSELLIYQDGSGAQRLLSYFQKWRDRYFPHGESSCLAVKLSAEVSDISEPMREVLVDGMHRIEARLSQAIRRGQDDGSLAEDINPQVLAATLYQLWVGAELLAKVQRSQLPLDRALAQTKAWLAV